jgi:hypothetical protein
MKHLSIINKPKEMKIFNYLTANAVFPFAILHYFCCVSLLVACNDDNNVQEPPVDEGYVAPEPPTEINEYNLFAVEFYSKLTDENLFKGTSYEPVINHINSEKKTLFFFFDRTDMTPNQSSPVVDMAWKTKNVPFFVQNNSGSGTVEGTGVITRQLVSAYPGAYIDNSLFIAGCNVTVPLYQTNHFSLMTCKINEKSQFDLLAKRQINGAESVQIVIGTINAELEDDFKEYLRHALTDFRVAVRASAQPGKTYKLFILSPVNFVVREVTETAVGNFPLYQCKIEYLE